MTYTPPVVYVDNPPSIATPILAADLNGALAELSRLSSAATSLLTGVSPGPAIWLDARIPTGVSTVPYPEFTHVTTWADVSGNGHAAVASFATPLYENSPQAAMTWATPTYMDIPYPNAVMRQYYVVAKATAVPTTGNANVLIGGTGVGQLSFGLFGPAQVFVGIENVAALGALPYTADSSAFHVYSFSYENPGIWRIRADGSLLGQASDTHVVGANLAIRIGNDFVATDGWEGQIAAVLAFTDVHDDAASFRVEKFLAGVYGATFPGGF